MESYLNHNRYLTQNEMIEILKSFHNQIKTHEERITDLSEYPVELLTVNRIEYNEQKIKTLENHIKHLAATIMNQQELIEKLMEQNAAIQHMNNLLMECNICSKSDNDVFIRENK